MCIRDSQGCVERDRFGPRNTIATLESQWPPRRPANDDAEQARKPTLSRATEWHTHDPYR
eukprot:2541868-Pyramimonas_sp.AAC.1